MNDTPYLVIGVVTDGVCKILEYRVKEVGLFEGHFFNLQILFRRLALCNTTHIHTYTHTRAQCIEAHPPLDRISPSVISMNVTKSTRHNRPIKHPHGSTRLAIDCKSNTAPTQPSFEALRPAPPRPECSGRSPVTRFFPSPSPVLEEHNQRPTVPTYLPQGVAYIL